MLTPLPLGEADAKRRVRAGFAAQTSYEGGTLTVQPTWLESIVESTGDHAGLITALRQSYSELIALAQHFEDSTANRTFPAVIYDGRGKVLFQGPLTFARLVLKFLIGHMRQHTDQIKSLSESPPSAAESRQVR